MFAKEIDQMTLTSDVADRLFDNITAAPYGTDKTFAATLRALLRHRLPDSESLHTALVPIRRFAVTADIITESIRQANFGHSYTVYIVFPINKEFGKELLDNARNHIGEGRQYLDSYVPQEDLRVFYVHKLDGLFYTNANSAIIFLDYLDIRRFHALQMMIPKYLPALFENSPLSEAETALLKSLGEKSGGEYERLIEDSARQLDMRGEIIRTRLKDFETAFEREQAQKAQQRIESYQRDCKNMLDNLRRTTQLMQEQQIILAGLQCGINGSRKGESELMEYFLCNKQLSVMRVIGTELEFVAHGYADVFDEEAFATCVDNEDSYLYSDICGFVTKAGMERLYRAIFEDGHLKLRVCAAYRADMRNGITPLDNYAFPPESRDYLPNPHIQNYGCIGGYASRFAEYMLNRDYVGAIDQAAVSARNLNFYDSVVMEELAHTLPRTAVRCVEDAEGKLMTPLEAIKKLEVAACQNLSESPTI